MAVLVASVTLVLAVLALCALGARSAASRYAILFWAMVTVGASPLIVAASRSPMAREILPTPVVRRAAVLREAVEGAAANRTVGDRPIAQDADLNRDPPGTRSIVPWLAGFSGPPARC